MTPTKGQTIYLVTGGAVRSAKVVQVGKQRVRLQGVRGWREHNECYPDRASAEEALQRATARAAGAQAEQAERGRRLRRRNEPPPGPTHPSTAQPSPPQVGHQPLPAQISHIAAAQGQPGSCSALGAEAPAMQRQPWQQMQADEADLLVQLAHAEVAVSDIQRQLRACREARLLAAHREIVRLREERDEARREVEDRAGDGCKEWS